MSTAHPADIRALDAALDAVEQEERKLLDGLTESQGVWRADLITWSVVQCLDHPAIANQVSLRAMEPSAQLALPACT